MRMHIVNRLDDGVKENKRKKQKIIYKDEKACK